MQLQSAIKGLGAMSDREFQTLSASAAALNRDMSEDAFKKELERVQKALESTKTKLETNSFFNKFEGGGSEGTNPKVQSSQAISKTLASTLTAKFPPGSTGGQCGDFVRNVTKQFGLDYPRLGDSLTSKINAVKQYGTSPANAKVGSVIVTKENPTYGHVAWIIGQNANGYVVAESNFKQSNKVSYGRVIPYNSSKIVGVINPKATA